MRTPHFGFILQGGRRARKEKLCMSAGWFQSLTGFRLSTLACPTLRVEAEGYLGCLDFSLKVMGSVVLLEAVLPE